VPVIADYELIREIGHGSYGDVWLARGLTGVYRAVKIVWRDRFPDAEPFEREFKGLKKFMAASLPEAGQLALLHVGQNERAGFFFYVMELADDVQTGREVNPAKYAPLTLKELRAQRGRLPAEECVRIAIELTRALAGLHAQGLVHRDIKPSNVIMVGGVPKLADIGLVASTADALTYVGTSGFVPPEGPGKPAADVFALGRLLYELATGLDREDYPRLPQELAKVPDRNLLFALNDIILRCCEPMPEQRYADAAALLSDLEALRAGRRARRAPGALLATAVAAVVVAVGAGVFLLARKSPAPAAPVPVATAAPAAAPISEKAIAVLPFANLSGDKTQEYFSDGLSEELLNTLAKIPGLKVSGRTSAFSFKGRSVPASEIARQLGVAYVLDGSVRRSGDRVRIAAQLIKAADDSQVWTENFERDAKDIFAVQDEVAAKVAENLRVKFSGRPAPVAINTEAFALYLQGRQAWNERTPAALARAEELFNRTLALEPKFARAHVGLADVALAKALLDPGLRLPTFTRRDAPEFAAIAAQIERALALDPNLAEAHTSLGGVLIFGWRIADAQRELRLAVMLNPNYGTAHQWLGRALIADGRIEEGLAELKLAAGVDPLASRILDNYAYGLELAGRYSEALAVDDRALAVSPGAWQATEGKIRILLRLRRDEEARAIVRRIGEADPRRYGDIPVYLIARAGLREEAARIFQPSPDGAYDAIHLLALGRQDEALASLTPDRTNAVILDSILFDPDYDPLRGNPRFTEYIAELGLADAYARAQAWRAAHPPESAAPKVTAAPLPAVETAADKSLVVLPLENLSPDPENAFFTDGLHTEIIATLSRLPDLKVTSRGTARGFKGVATPLAEIGQKLGVANILSGSVRREGRSVRVQLELRRASDEAVLWQKAFNREMQPGFALQDEIGADVARILQARADAGWYSGAKFMTKNPEAYDLFLKARELPFLRGPSLETFVEEGRLAEEALRLDPRIHVRGEFAFQRPQFRLRQRAGPRQAKRARRQGQAVGGAGG
jgi:TolB-like protein/tetratricopeptide (TPR) repeat protein